VADQLTAVRDGLGLGEVLDRLDNSRATPTGGHTDDLDALIMLTHTHPHVDDFEAWLRSSLTRSPAVGPSITLSTVHRVKGLEWPHVVVWDASLDLMPHRLASDIEEERRIFHVAVTRCSESATVVSRAGSVSPFVSQLHHAAPAPPPTAPPEVEAEIGMRLTWQGFDVEIAAIEDGAALATVGSSSRIRIPFGETVKIGARRLVLRTPPGPPLDAGLLERLKEWRRERAAADGVPAYVVAHDAHLTSIASRRPTSLADLARCDGIGPSRLDRYGDAILTVVGKATVES
jgi:DNA helicase-2/ATP-dependent DNA helicase PcrA